MDQFYYICRFFLILVVLFYGTIQAQEHHHHDHSPVSSKLESPMAFIHNQGQWHSNVQYRAYLSTGDVWLESDRITYTVLNEHDLEQAHEQTHSKEYQEKPFDFPVHGHAFSTRFVGANLHSRLNSEHRHSDYYNFFVGNDRSKWASNVPAFSSVTYQDLYPGVDLKAYSHENHFKYDFLLAPKSDPNQIHLEYSGDIELSLQDGHLVILTSVGEVIEQRPIAYLETPHGRLAVACNYQILSNGVVGFEFPDGYNSNFPLVIDPIVITATYAGTLGSTTYGHTSTFDVQGNIYGGANSFNTGYPVTTGAFQVIHSSGSDFGITKMLPDGSSRVYSTLIGGNSRDLPHSLIVNSLGQLCILGSTESIDFPVTPNAYDTSFNGFIDISVTVLDVNGTGVIASTFLGSSGSDGVNSIIANYGDQYKGEINLDNQDRVYVASFSSGSDFPVDTANAIQGIHGGGQDGVVARFSPNLSVLEWSTYLGGPSDDSAYNVKIASDGTVYVCGGAGDGLPTTTGSHAPVFLGGTSDGYIAHIDANGTSLMELSYFGTSARDQAFFLELDKFDDVFVFGQSNGTLTATTGAYVGPGTGSFIIKMEPNLSAVNVVSTFARVAPTAFLVDNCNNIYIAGHGANASSGNYDTTAGAFQTTFGGFYLMVLEPNATNMLFGSFYANNGAHVDGGTSRFDKRGVIYEAVCTNTGAPTTSWAAEPAFVANGWDLYLFKIDLEFTGTVANAFATPSVSGCVPFSVQFSNQGSVGVSQLWDFDDNGATDTSASPTHLFSDTGTYNVRFITIDSLSCNIADTTYVTVFVGDTLSLNLPSDTTICDSVFTFDPGTIPNANYLWSNSQTQSELIADTSGVYVLQVSRGNCLVTDTINVNLLSGLTVDLGVDTTTCDPQFNLSANVSGVTYLWSTSQTTPSITVDTSGIYWVQITAGTCTASDSIFVSIDPLELSIGSDTTLCNDSLILDAGPGATGYLWFNGDTTQTIVADTTGLYWVTISNGICSRTDSINLTVQDEIVVDLGPDTATCEDSLILNAGNPGATYFWSDSSNNQQLQLTSTGTYYVVVSSGVCKVSDTVTVSFNAPKLFFSDQVICDQDFETLDAGNPGASYLWSTGATSQTIEVNESKQYYVLVTYQLCSASDSMRIDFGRSPEIDLGEDRYLCTGESVDLLASEATDLVYNWSTGASTNQVSISDGGTYWVRANNLLCESNDSITITQLGEDAVLSVPNVFTPNNDGSNECFEPALAGELNAYEFKVFNRWGNLVYQSQFPGACWDGRILSGRPVSEGVYYWIATFRSACYPEKEQVVRGNVTLLR